MDKLLCHSNNVQNNNSELLNKINNNSIIKKNAIENRNNSFFNIINYLETIVKDHLTKYNNFKQYIHPEIEIRLGRCVYHMYPNNEKKYNKFKNGVDEFFWDDVLCMFNQYSNWFYIKDWEFKIDYIYKPIISNNNNFSQSLSYCNNSKLTTTKKNNNDNDELKESQNALIDEYTQYRYTQGDNLNWLEKRTYSDIVLETKNDNLYDAKISISNEKKLKQDQIPEKKNLSWVRLKNRKSFFLTCNETPNFPMWRYDLTMVWEGYDYKEAIINFNHHSPLFEIECECINPYEFINNNNHFNLCNSLINKFKDIEEPFFLNNKKILETSDNNDRDKNNNDIETTMIYSIINHKSYNKTI